MRTRSGHYCGVFLFHVFFKLQNIGCRLLLCREKRRVLLHNNTLLIIRQKMPRNHVLGTPQRTTAVARRRLSPTTTTHHNRPQQNLPSTPSTPTLQLYRTPAEPFYILSGCARNFSFSCSSDRYIFLMGFGHPWSTPGTTNTQKSGVSPLPRGRQQREGGRFRLDRR